MSDIQPKERFHFGPWISKRERFAAAHNIYYTAKLLPEEAFLILSLLPNFLTAAVIHTAEMETLPFSLLQYVPLGGMQLELEEVAYHN